MRAPLSGENIKVQILNAVSPEMKSRQTANWDFGDTCFPATRRGIHVKELVLMSSNVSKNPN